MRELYIVVHGDVVKGDAEFGIGSAEEALKEITRLKQYNDWLDIPRCQSARTLHPNMPSVTPDLVVLVAGANKWCCCSLQLYSLRRAGYSAKFFERACYDGSGDGTRPQHLFSDTSDAADIIPEFFRV